MTYFPSTIYFRKRLLILASVLFAPLVQLQAKVLTNPPVREFTIFVNPVFNRQRLLLETGRYITGAGDTVLIERFRFYLSAFELILEDGTVYREPESYHLVDVEKDGSMKIVLKNVPPGKINEITFSIGVDSLKSVSGAMDGDLDPRHGMYWAWNSGYINAELEGRSKSCTAHQNRFEFHIGGYSGADNALRKTSLKLNSWSGNELVITADVQKWFTGVSLRKVSAILIPGKDAMQMADNYSVMFKAELTGEK